MTRYVLQRLALVPLVALLVASCVFFLVRLLPGDVATILSAETPRYGNAEQLRDELGLNKPILEQYTEFIGGVVTGDFGESLFYNRAVSGDLRRAIPVTVELTVLAVLLSVLIAVPLGVLSAANRNSWLDRSARGISVLFVSIPNFWTGTIALTLLGIWFAWTPPLNYEPIWVDPVKNVQQFAIPAFILALSSVGLKLRLVRNQMLEVLSQDYIRTAHAKGLSRSKVVNSHALRNAMVPVVAIVGNQTGALLGGVTITESIFNLPGLGRNFLDGVNNRDYPVIQSTALIIAFFLVAVNFVTDLAYAWLDPRIRYS